MTTILITGFGRFPGSPVNPSGLIAARLAGRRRPALAEVRRIAHVFATRYDAVDRELPQLIARERPDIIVMFGVATRAKMLRVEELARNRISSFPDAGGRRPKARVIAQHRGAWRNRLPPAPLLKAARSTGLKATRSRNAGAYLCNYAYWRGLEACTTSRGPSVVIFIHVPPIRPETLRKRVPNAKDREKMARARIGPLQRATQLDDLVRAGEAIIIAMLALHRSGARAALPARPVSC
jgi:pyroglutamyl-peptidase